MKLTFSKGFKICDERDHPLHFETETETFALWSQNLRLILRLLKSVSNFETDTETFGRWSQSLRPALRPPWSQSQSRDQSLAHLWFKLFCSIYFGPNIFTWNNQVQIRSWSLVFLHDLWWIPSTVYFFWTKAHFLQNFVWHNIIFNLHFFGTKIFCDPNSS